MCQKKWKCKKKNNKKKEKKKKIKKFQFFFKKSKTAQNLSTALTLTLTLTLNPNPNLIVRQVGSIFSSATWVSASRVDTAVAAVCDSNRSPVASEGGGGGTNENYDLRDPVNPVTSRESTGNNTRSVAKC